MAQVVDPVFTFNLTLVEGVNTIKISSTDAAGNVSASVERFNLELDTVPPVLTNILPADGVSLFSQNVNISGTANESLSIITVNDLAMAFDENSKQFSGSLFFPVEGAQVLNFVASDKAGNTTSFTHNIDIILKLLREELITIMPKENVRLEIEGLMGASRPGLTIEARASLFNQTNIVAESDGSFSATLDFFNEVTLTAEDLALGRTESVTLSYNVDTTFTGMVKDTSNKSLTRSYSHS